MREVQAAKESLERSDDGFVSTWWGKRWIEAIENVSTAFANRLPRGLDYARGGHIEDIRVGCGKVQAQVQGRRKDPYKVTIQVKTLTNAQWNRVIQGMAERAACAASLLAGELSDQVIEAFAQCGLSLFPTRIREIKTTCSCPDWANPCKHIAAVLYNLGDALDSDPFLLLTLRGRTQEQVLEQLRASRAGLNLDDTKGLDNDNDTKRGIPVGELEASRFYKAQGTFADYRFHITQPEIDTPLLRRLGSPEFWGGSQPLDAYLLPVYHAVASVAEELGLQDDVEIRPELLPSSYDEEEEEDEADGLSGPHGAVPAALAFKELEESDEDITPEERTVLVRRRRAGDKPKESSRRDKQKRSRRKRSRNGDDSNASSESSQDASDSQPRLSRRVVPGNAEGASIEERLELIMPIVEGIEEGPHIAKQIVWALKKHGSATARQLARRTRLKKTAVLSMLQSLLTVGLVVQEGQGERARYVLG